MPCLARPEGVSGQRGRETRSNRLWRVGRLKMNRLIIHAPGAELSVVRRCHGAAKPGQITSRCLSQITRQLAFRKMNRWRGDIHHLPLVSNRNRARVRSIPTLDDIYRRGVSAGILFSFRLAAANLIEQIVFSVHVQGSSSNLCQGRVGGISTPI